MAGPTTAPRGAAKRADTPAGPPSVDPGRRRLSRRTRLLLGGVGVALIAVATLWVLYGSSWFRVERVTTTGTDVLTRAEVEAAAAVPVGSPLVSVDTGAIEARLRQKVPRIDSVDVVRSWPHGIGLKVIERKPVLVVEKGGKFVEVDAKGVRFATVDERPGHVPLLKLAPDRSPSLKRYGGDRLLREGVRVAGDLPGKVAQETETVRITSYDSVVLELTRGRTVMWGSGERGPVKARVLTALMKAAPKAGHFDVSAPTAPAVSKS
ncbi:FtsQ-type POTRA domain-containing protein [Streptomyces sp. NBC_01754]|uniref:cell division protein FtsQ/DivIB n=1 Tax=Streptomyces sp. NBC_01754 TaxID=2975930 RepID=UPI002DDAEDC3|nr:FtsQ-type POTRA domain-containing protein [Streptomyces sp. NBC_01754]WSC92016.1 FtsQ-type POTRA domain-containing protein [Streptomyces sp. NBC_01754]